MNSRQLTNLLSFIADSYEVYSLTGAKLKSEFTKNYYSTSFLPLQKLRLIISLGLYDHPFTNKPVCQS